MSIKIGIKPGRRKKRAKIETEREERVQNPQKARDKKGEKVSQKEPIVECQEEERRE
ncbi:MAG: hypothetical protein JSS34_07420 [Proteobacteria bacterium]|nr:hypothetical protein [Pseudomonadota bacterium]